MLPFSTSEEANSDFRKVSSRLGLESDRNECQRQDSNPGFSETKTQALHHVAPPPVRWPHRTARGHTRVHDGLTCGACALSVMSLISAKILPSSPGPKEGTVFLARTLAFMLGVREGYLGTGAFQGAATRNGNRLQTTWARGTILTINACGPLRCRARRRGDLDVHVLTCKTCLC